MKAGKCPSGEMTLKVIIRKKEARFAVKFTQAGYVRPVLYRGSGQSYCSLLGYFPAALL